MTDAHQRQTLWALAFAVGLGWFCGTLFAFIASSLHGAWVLPGIVSMIATAIGFFRTED